MLAGLARELLLLLRLMGLLLLLLLCCWYDDELQTMSQDPKSISVGS
jgi:hypothetical protein